MVCIESENEHHQLIRNTRDLETFRILKILKRGIIEQLPQQGSEWQLLDSERRPEPEANIASLFLQGTRHRSRGTNQRRLSSACHAEWCSGSNIQQVLENEFFTKPKRKIVTEISLVPIEITQDLGFIIRMKNVDTVKSNETGHVWVWIMKLNNVDKVQNNVTYVTGHVWVRWVDSNHSSTIEISQRLIHHVNQLASPGSKNGGLLVRNHDTEISTISESIKPSLKRTKTMKYRQRNINDIWEPQIHLIIGK